MCAILFFHSECQAIEFHTCHIFVDFLHRVHFLLCEIPDWIEKGKMRDKIEGIGVDMLKFAEEIIMQTEDCLRGNGKIVDKIPSVFLETSYALCTCNNRAFVCPARTLDPANCISIVLRSGFGEKVQRDMQGQLDVWECMDRKQRIKCSMQPGCIFLAWQETNKRTFHKVMGNA